MACMSKQWKALSEEECLWKKLDLRRVFPSMIVLNKAFWEKYVDLKKHDLEIKETPLNRKSIMDLKKFMSLKIEREGPVTLVTVPKNLNLDKLEAVAQSPKRGNPTSLCFKVYDLHLKKLKEISVNETYRVALSSFTYYNNDMRRELFNKWKSSEMLPVATSVLLSYFSEKSDLIDMAPHSSERVYTYCSERYASQHIIVGTHVQNNLAIVESMYVDNSNIRDGIMLKV
jgi:hypothetical protein